MRQVTAPEISQVCTSVGTLIGVIVTAVLTLRNGRKSTDILHRVNGLSDARDAATSLSAFARGADAQRVQDGGNPNATEPVKHPLPILTKP